METNPSSPPFLIDEIQRQLAEVSKLREEIERAGETDLSARLELHAIRGLEEQMISELRAAEFAASGADLEMTLIGEPVKGSEIFAGFLGDVLRTFQDLLNAVAQVFSGAPTSRAPVQRNIIVETRLRVLTFQPGSFGVRLRLPSRAETGELFEPQSREVLVSVCESLTEPTPSTNSSELLSHPRVKSHYAKLTQLLAKEAADATFRYASNPHGVVLSASKAREKNEWLDLLQTKEDIIQIEGRLVGGSLEKRRFELQGGETTYSGRVSEEAVRKMKGLAFGSLVNARLKILTTEHETGGMEPSISYFAENFESMDQ